MLRPTHWDARGTVASKTVVELLDDLDGGRADETVRFALDGVEYEIDLSAPHATALRDVLAVYIGHAHRPRKARRAAEDSHAHDNHVRNGGGNGAGKPSESARMTAEIRRLASESAQKVSQAARAATVRGSDDRDDMPDASNQPAAPPLEPTPATVGPVPALVIPFMEAGL
jgi:hypothetical protein